MIPRPIEQRFPPMLRTRGTRYAAEGRVVLQPVTDTHAIYATVEGSTQYFVVIELGGRAAGSSNAAVRTRKRTTSASTSGLCC